MNAGLVTYVFMATHADGGILLRKRIIAEGDDAAKIMAMRVARDLSDGFDTITLDGPQRSFVFGPSKAWVTERE